MSIRHKLLKDGFFPKELPPGFGTIDFANWSTTTKGNAIIENLFLQCILGSAKRTGDGIKGASAYGKYSLLRAGLNPRELALPNPFAYAGLAETCVRNFSLLLKRAESKWSLSAPKYDPDGDRAISPRGLPSRIAGHRAERRAYSQWILNADVERFYPSLYTHAIAWAIDSKTRKDWGSGLFGNQVDCAIRNMQSRESYGIPIGPDLCFLLAEVVGANIDKRMAKDAKSEMDTYLRWFDDIEVGVRSGEEGEKRRHVLMRELGQFRLTLSAPKTKINRLPTPIDSPWKDVLKSQSVDSITEVISLYNIAYDLRERYPNDPILAYATAMLFGANLKKWKRGHETLIALLLQAILAEHGCAPKVVSLLCYFKLIGVNIDEKSVRTTVETLIRRDAKTGVGGDVAWVLHLCFVFGIELSDSTAKELAKFNQAPVLLFGLALAKRKLLKSAPIRSKVEKMITSDCLWGENWLTIYEARRNKWISDPGGLVKSTPGFKELFKSNVAFFSPSNDLTAAIFHTAGSPTWFQKQVQSDLLKAKETEETQRWISELFAKMLSEGFQDVEDEPLAERKKRIRAYLRRKSKSSTFHYE